MNLPPTSSFLVIGHRGAAGLVAENTLPSFARAFELGCRAIELDVHNAQDGLAVIHDQDLARTTNRRGPIGALSLAELQTINAGNGAMVPSLAQVFELARSFTRKDRPLLINIELKGSGTAAPVAQFLRGLEGDFEVLISAFDHAELRRFRTLDANAAVAPLYDRWDKHWRHLAADLRATCVNVNARILSAPRVREIRQAGFELYAYTVNTLERAQRLADWGVNGVFTDRPDLLLPEFGEQN